MRHLIAGLILFIPFGIFAETASFVIRDVRLFDGESVYQKVDLVIRDGVISGINEKTDLSKLPQIDGSNSTLLPGLLDAHAHTEYVGQLQESLWYGVTTVFDMGTVPATEKILREAAANRTDVADYRAAGIFITAPGGHGTEFGYDAPTLADASGANDFVQNIIQGGADYLKVIINGVRHARDGMPILDNETVYAAVKAGRDNGMMVLAHIESGDDTRLAINAGVDGLVHHWRDAGARPELARLIASNNIFVMPTPTAIDGMLGVGPAQMLVDPLISPYLSDLSRRELTKPMPVPAGVTMDPVNEGIQSLIEADVVLLAGTDAFTHNPRIVHGASMHRLLELLVEAGLSPTAALRAATANVADAFSLSDRGRIKPGLRADLVLVNGDPTVDIRSTRDIRMIWRAGIEVERMKNYNYLK